jgi:uncharacterized membrane protein
MHSEVVVTILGMAVVTYRTRASGLWLVGRMGPSPRLNAALRHLPGAVLVALVSPIVLGNGPSGMLAALATVLVTARTGNFLSALGVGVRTVWVLRPAPRARRNAERGTGEADSPWPCQIRVPDLRRGTARHGSADTPSF